MQNQQVDPVDSELRRAFLETVQRLVVSVVADPDLGFEEDVVPGDLGARERLPHLAFVVVRRGGVDVSIAEFQSRGHGGPSVFR